MTDQPDHSTTPAPGEQPDAPTDNDRAGTDRRAFLKLAGRRAVYVAPAVVTLAAASRANAASTTSPS
ncbi:MAG: hypothetical protein AAF586_03780 [Planctomycetota bacterium]